MFCSFSSSSTTLFFINKERVIISSKYTLNLEDIITKIKNDSEDVDNLNDGHYYVRTGMIMGNSVYADVYTKNGYVTKVEYDLTNHFRTEGYSKYKVSFDLYNYNDKDLM